MVESPWTKQRTARLRRLWRAGRSGSQIAAALDVSRGAVFGKLTRLGLLGRLPHKERVRRMASARARYLARAEAAASL
jgi:hypothetical protein